MQNHTHPPAAAPSTSSYTRRGSAGPTLQLICLASGGGPSEDNVTGFLVRSVHTDWGKNSILAVDAGTHMAAITRILERDFPSVARTAAAAPVRNSAAGRGRAHDVNEDCESSCSSRQSTPEPTLRVLDSGPFQGLPFPHASARANALHVVREHISTYLITHPHLDHISAFAINTAAFHNTTRPKRLAALPSTVNAIKQHIFNDVIWPNLTDEDGGVGFVTFQRLAQGGRLEVGEGSGKGYIEVCDGLCVKGMKISHGHCIRGPPSVQRGSDVGLSDATVRRSSQGAASGSAVPDTSPRTAPTPGNLTRTHSISVGAGQGWPQGSQSSTPAPPHELVVDSTAYFIRDDWTKREILMFGDVEPDAVSFSPRNAQIWAEAAPKIASGALRAIVIECSYDDSQPDAVLFGHLVPRHLVRELANLAEMVKLRRREHRTRREARKRKRMGSTDVLTLNLTQGQAPTAALAESPSPTGTDLDSGVGFDLSPDESATTRRKRGRTTVVHPTVASTAREVPPERRPSVGGVSSPDNISPMMRPRDSTKRGSVLTAELTLDGVATPPARPSIDEARDAPPLEGIQVLIMHMKDTLRDSVLVGDTILQQLQEHEARLREADGVGLGCEFVITEAGGSYFF